MGSQKAPDRIQIFESILRPWAPGRLLDLGAGHGKFSLAAQRLGWHVTAVDARTERMPMAKGIEWIQADVRDFEGDRKLDSWDCIAVLGLLYHLELPDIFRLLRRCAGTPTVIDTHVALKAEVTQDGYEGRFFTEELDKPTAAHLNVTSFWPTESALIRVFRDSGFVTMLKLTPPYRPDRTFWVCT